MEISDQRMFLFHVGVYTGYPVAYACLTPEEGREEMRGHVFIHESSSGANAV